VASANPELANWVTKSSQNLAKHPGEYLTATLQEIVYYILSLPPFRDWAGDPARRVRLARITALIESFASMPVPGYPNVSRGGLKSSTTNPGHAHEPWSRQFYHLFFGYLARVGLDEEEDEDVITPMGMMPIMTMHQAKGLQFPFVFVGHMGADADISISHELETRFAPFPSNPTRSFIRLAESVRAELDLIRQYYVAYSRAQYALVLMGTNAQFSKGRIPCGPDSSWLPTRILPL
jgi:DNA helicase-2/ATP-dependent DNA helicase PcrA